MARASREQQARRRGGFEPEPAPGLGARFPLFVLLPAPPVKWTPGGQNGVNLIIKCNWGVTKKRGVFSVGCKLYPNYKTALS